MAHSMGGHILLRRLHDVPQEFSAAVLCAPMITIQPRKVPWWIVGLLSRIITREAPSEEFVDVGGSRPQKRPGEGEE